MNLSPEQLEALVKKITAEVLKASEEEGAAPSESPSAPVDKATEPKIEVEVEKEPEAEIKTEMKSEDKPEDKPSDKPEDKKSEEKPVEEKKDEPKAEDKPEEKKMADEPTSKKEEIPAETEKDKKEDEQLPGMSDMSLAGSMSAEDSSTAYMSLVANLSKAMGISERECMLSLNSMKEDGYKAMADALMDEVKDESKDEGDKPEDKDGEKNMKAMSRKGMSLSIRTLSRALDAANAKVKKYEDAEKKAEEIKLGAEVDALVASGKLHPSDKEETLKMAVKSPKEFRAFSRVLRPTLPVGEGAGNTASTFTAAGSDSMALGIAGAGIDPAIDPKDPVVIDLNRKFDEAGIKNPEVRKKFILKHLSSALNQKTLNNAAPHSGGVARPDPSKKK